MTGEDLVPEKDREIGRGLQIAPPMAHAPEKYRDLGTVLERDGDLRTVPGKDGDLESVLEKGNLEIVPERGEDLETSLGGDLEKDQDQGIVHEKKRDLEMNLSVVLMVLTLEKGIDLRKDRDHALASVREISIDLGHILEGDGGQGTDLTREKVLTFNGVILRSANVEH